ncbi:MlaD family protein [Pseudonocardia alni]|uniref:MlaD family protein n=1 Tax=Pseudonocardia alni TaxID=33907 RepID=UPI0033D11F1A
MNTRRMPAWLRKNTSFRLGLLVVVVSLVAGVALFAKAQILTTLSPGDTITVNFAAQYQLRPFLTQAKVSGVPVGKVTSVDRTDEGTAEVGLKVDSGVLQKLGTAPTAAIRPTTLLGGNYYVDLIPGGEPGPSDDEIPLERTKLPVELEKIAATLQPDARDGARAATRNLDATLENGGTDALRALVASAPGALEPAGGALTGLQGTRPDTDLPTIVTNLEKTGRVLTRNQGQLDSVVADLQTFSGVLARRSGDVSAALDTLPDSLRTANVGLDRLDGSLAKLRETAGPARPIVQQLDRTLAVTDPVLVEARPVVADLRSTLVDLRPTVDGLVPASQQLTEVSDDLRGPVLDRVNGPIMDTVLSPYRGTGVYEGNGADFPFYEAVGYVSSNLANTAQYTDRNGATAAFHPGVGPGSVSGLPFSLEQMFQALAQQQAGGTPR